MSLIPKYKKYSFLFFLIISCALLFSYKATYAYLTSLFEIKTNTIATGNWVTPTPTPLPARVVINEVYYDPDAEHTVGGQDADNSSEWIELYNPTSFTVNLKDWKITDNSSTERTVTTSNRNIGPGEFVILAKAANVRTEWGFSNDIFIPIGEIFGNGLANTGDRVIMKDNNGTTIDQMSYGTDNTILNPSAGPLSDGHSLERDPDGVDTNTSADFVDRDTPTPGS